MADNILLDNGTLTDFTGSADDIGGVLVQRVKVQFGADGSATDASSADPLPVNDSATGAVADAAATVGGIGSTSAKLRLVTSQLDAIKTAVEILDNTVAGSEMQVDVVSIPAAARTTDTVSATLATDKLMENLTALTPKFKSLTIAPSQTDTSVVALVSSKKIRVLSLVVQCGATATTITFESDGGADTRLHKVPAGANGGQVLGFNPLGWFETVAGEALIATTGAGSDTEITLCYVEAS